MIEHFFLEKIKENFGFTPTEEQIEVLTEVSSFLFSPNSDSMFLLKGYAGTGKSSLIGALVKTMTGFNQKTVLLAPTGRAAKVFATYANHPAFTIHKKIYRQKRFSNEASGFVPVDNMHKDTLFIVDEASMISNDGIDSFIFGTGRLLDDLVQYVYSGENCRLLLIGDSAQLPPVMQEYSPALQSETLKAYGLDLFEKTMTQIVRQAEHSGILYNATLVRQLLEDEKTNEAPQLKFDGFSDIIRLSGEDLIDEITSSYDSVGIKETAIISRSNKRSKMYNEGVRNRILYLEDELAPGDLLMIAKNNYFWTENIEQIDFLANGEIVEVLRVRKTNELYGFRFCDVLVKHTDYEIEIEVKILLDTLHTDVSGLPKQQSDELFFNIMEDYSDITTKAGKMRKIKENPHYNALQVKYGYAVTCHKAQGGEWKNVFIDLGYIPEEYLNANFYRWLYTAFTRASEKLYLINLPDNFVKTANKDNK